MDEIDTIRCQFGNLCTYTMGEALGMAMSQERYNLYEE